MKSSVSLHRVFWISLLMLPRFARIVSPDVQIEDPNYIYGAFLLLKGMIPFADFAQVNPPLLESLLAILYRVFGVSYRVPEFLTAIAFFLTALLIGRLGDRFINRFAGWSASILYSFHFLVFRYHVFEREIFATLAVFLALDFLSRGPQSRWTPAVAGLLLGFGFACKQTVIIPFAAVVGVVGVMRWQWHRAILLVGGFGFLVGIITLGYTLAFGPMYMEQTFWFHFIKGFVAPWFIKAQWTLAGLGYLVPLSCAGLWGLRFKRLDWNWLWPAMLMADLAFFWFVSGAFWPHYLLSTLPSAALLSGLGLEKIRALIGNCFRDRFLKSGADSRDRIPKSSLASLGTLTVVLLYMQVFYPGSLWGTGAANRYGFAGTPRAEVSRVAAVIQNNTRENDLIISDPFIALEAQRIKVVRFKDNWGLILWMKRKMDAGEYREAVKLLSKQRFGDVRRRSHAYWMPLIETAFAQGIVGAVQPNYELPLEESNLHQYGMKKAYTSSYYTIWVRKQVK
ncbi:MAG TPA: glycosyltransferase family 39 protein [bacterium]|nr:glycosyltransferase family 39 protein [bacterium]